MPFAFMAAVVTITAYIFSKEPTIPGQARRLCWSYFCWSPSAHLTRSTRNSLGSNGIRSENSTDDIGDGNVNNRPKTFETMIWVIVLSLAYYGTKGGIFTIVHGGVHRVQGPSGTFLKEIMKWA